jgi:hypothetical protein
LTEVESIRKPGGAKSEWWCRILTCFWFKMIGTMCFTLLFFVAYLYLLRYPAHPVFLIPLTPVDRLVGFQPAALPLYLSLWAYVSLPPALMLSHAQIVAYGVKVSVPCLIGLGVFYLWPNAVPPARIDWAQHPGVLFLKSIDMAGNACPSLHVATAVFSCLWLFWFLPARRAGRLLRVGNVLWCVGIIYSTMAIRQHVALDVLAGTALGVASAWMTGLRAHARQA